MFTLFSFFMNLSMPFCEVRFDLKHLDRELNNLLEATVPPVDITSISAFRTALQKLAKQARLRSHSAFNSLAN